MKRVVLVVSVLSISLFILGTVESSATPLAILNPSFESNQPADGGWIADPLRGDFIRTINDWTIIGGARPSGTWQPTNLPYPSGVPHGLNVAYVGVSNAISQVLSETLTANYRYSLSVYVGHRSDKTFPITTESIK